MVLYPTQICECGSDESHQRRSGFLSLLFCFHVTLSSTALQRPSYSPDELIFRSIISKRATVPTTPHHTITRAVDRQHRGAFLICSAAEPRSADVPAPALLPRKVNFLVPTSCCVVHLSLDFDPAVEGQARPEHVTVRLEPYRQECCAGCVGDNTALVRPLRRCCVDWQWPCLYPRLLLLRRKCWQRGLDYGDAAPIPRFVHVLS